MKPKLMKKIGHPFSFPEILKKCNSFKKLNKVVKIFNKNSTLKTCESDDFYCRYDDSSANLVTAKRFGPLGCGCQQQTNWGCHF
jgi:hypothetical protein